MSSPPVISLSSTHSMGALSTVCVSVPVPGGQGAAEGSASGVSMGESVGVGAGVSDGTASGAAQAASSIRAGGECRDNLFPHVVSSFFEAFSFKTHSSAASFTIITW